MHVHAFSNSRIKKRTNINNAALLVIISHIYLLIHLSIPPFHPPIQNPTFYLFAHSSISHSIIFFSFNHLPNHPSINSSTCPFIYSFNHPSIHPAIHYVYLTSCLFLYPSFHSTTYQFIHQSTHLSVYPSTTFR